jgi:hypothetical protein
MPRATNNIQNLHHFDLKSLPEGYVKLRRMSYGQRLERDQMMMDMQMEMQGKKSGGGMSAKVDMMQKKVAAFEFAACIAEHNLTDENDSPLDFKRAEHVAILDALVGQEIGERINEIHDVEALLGNSTPSSDS